MDLSAQLNRLIEALAVEVARETGRDVDDVLEDLVVAIEKAGAQL
jgi:hypothetical protein